MNTGDIVKEKADRRRYLWYFGRHMLQTKILSGRIGIKRGEINRFGTRTLPGADETNDIIFQRIESGKPFALVRPGNGETEFAIEWEEQKLFGRSLYKRRQGFFEKCQAIYGNRTDEYQHLYRKDISDADIFSVFPDFIMEEYFAERWAPNAHWIHAWRMSPITAKRPWTDALKGKRVLVVSQFADYLVEQYNKRERIFKGEWSWPEMALIPVKSIFYFGPSKQFPTWFDALDYLYGQVMKFEFDIALLSCGSFAIHLAPMIKRAGRQAFQYAGELQILFGIRGARWDDSPVLKTYYNDSWIRVSKDQVGLTEEDSQNMDGGICYW